jgi:regulatory protein
VSDQPFKDAEAWLAEQGVERNPLRVPLEPPTPPGLDDDPATTGVAGPAAPAGDAAADAPPVPPTAPHPAEEDAPSDVPSAAPAADAPVHARQAARLAEASADEAVRRADAEAATPRYGTPRLEDDVAEAVSFARRSTANAPQAEGRIARKLGERGYGDVVIEQALERCREAGVVDDRAMADALVDEGRRKGHAPLRLRTDLRRRGLDEEAIEAALARTGDEDPEAAAFALAREKAATLSGVGAETAFRRVVAHLARRGHPEGLARKVAREAVFTARDQERTAGH